MPGIESKDIVHQCRSAWNKVALYTNFNAILNALSITDLLVLGPLFYYSAKDSMSFTFGLNKTTHYKNKTRIKLRVTSRF